MHYIVLIIGFLLDATVTCNNWVYDKFQLIFNKIDNNYTWNGWLVAIFDLPLTVIGAVIGISFTIVYFILFNLFRFCLRRRLSVSEVKCSSDSSK